MEKYKDTIKRIQPVAEEYSRTVAFSYPLTDLTTLLSAQGYYILKATAPHNLSGFYMKKAGYPFIFINSSHTLGRQNFSLLHEVYHHIMNHQNGISDFNSNSLEEREAEIFAGLVLLPDKEIEKWSDQELASPSTIAEISSYYQMSFSGTLVRLMQTGHVNYEQFKTLQQLSRQDRFEDLKNIYEDKELETNILYPSNRTQISENMMHILEQNYESGLTTADTINEIIRMIEGLNHD